MMDEMHKPLIAAPPSGAAPPRGAFRKYLDPEDPEAGARNSTFESEEVKSTSSSSASSALRRGILPVALCMLASVGFLVAKASYSASDESLSQMVGNSPEGEHGEGGGEHEEEGEHGGGGHSTLHSAPIAVLFPWFAQLVGIFVYLIISRYAHGVPYTAVMFIIGALIGVSIAYIKDPTDITISAKQWAGINGEVILLVFLPGLLYLDAYNVDVHLFFQSFWQLIIFAFPMVLAGTGLTACVLYFIFPYDWSLDFCMTGGAILAATDPVAVAVLLNELGAPPRLKVHISGESLLNDGSAYVFYTIFRQRFLYELGIEGIGISVGWGLGFAMFGQLAFGGACIGFAFGIGQVGLLFYLKRRLNQEENVVQVASTITTAYLVFFVSEIIAGCSGIVAVVVCAITVKLFGESLINDAHLTHDFWHITEHLLNTLLFLLAGTVWGDIIADDKNLVGTQLLFEGKDYGYLLILFLLLIVIRFFLTFAVFPLTSRIGIRSSWQEAVFMSYGGLRGAVGIALALSLFAEVFEYTENMEDEEKKNSFRDQVMLLFAFVGGIAFLTLAVNGPTAGPLLKKLGLVTPTNARAKVVANYEAHMKQNTLIEYLSILSDQRFKSIEYAVIRRYVSPLKEIEQNELYDAVKILKKKHPNKTPFLRNLLPYLVKSEASDEASGDGGGNKRKNFARPTMMIRPGGGAPGGARGTVYNLDAATDDAVESEERHIFISLLRREYQHQMETGELDARGFMPYSLLHSLNAADDAANHGRPLNDWEASQTLSKGLTNRGDRMLHKLRTVKAGDLCSGGNKETGVQFYFIRTQVLQALALIHAHEGAQAKFKEEFATVGEHALTASEKAVLDESKEQIAQAEAALETFDKNDVDIVKSQFVCKVLLSKSAKYFETLAHDGLMTDKEASEFLEHIEHEMFQLLLSAELESEGLLDSKTKNSRLSTLSLDVLSDLNIDKNAA